MHPSPLVPRVAVRFAAVVATACLSTAGLLSGLALTPAQAADDGTAGPSSPRASIDHVKSRAGSLQVLYSLPDTGKDEPDLSSVSVSVDGTDLPAKAALASDTSNQIRRSTLLAIDVSNSMAENGKFAAAKKAAQLFLRSVPANVYVGIVTFAGQVTTAQEPTLDRAALVKVVDGLRLSEGTHLYDGVSTSVDVLGTKGQRSVLVLSDGRDTSQASLPALVRKIRTSTTQVDVVALAQDASGKQLLKPLSDAGKGAVISADDPAELSRVFSEQARLLSNEVLVTVKPPADLTTAEGTLAVHLTAGTTEYTDTAFVTLRPAPAAKPKVRGGAPQAAQIGWQVEPKVLLAGIGAIGLGVLVLVLALFGGRGSKDESLESRIAAYTGKGAGQRPVAPPQGVAAQAVDMATKALASNRGLEVKLGGRLDAAGMSLKPAEWLLMHAGLAVGITLFTFLLTGGNALLTILGLVAGAVLPWLFLGFKKGRRLKAFNAQLAPTLQLMAGSLQAGLSLAQGMDTIVREGADPVASEFRRALVETRLGVQVDDALDSVAQRMMSEDFRWTVMAIRIQREVGGNLAELMLNVAATLREREYLRRQVKSLSAEGRFSAYILLVMPPGVLAYEAVSNPTYLHPLVSTAIGFVMLAGMVGLMGLGAFMMSRMIKLEV